MTHPDGTGCFCFHSRDDTRGKLYKESPSGNAGWKPDRIRWMKKIAGIVFVGILIGLAAAYYGAKSHATGVAEKRVNRAIAKAANFADIDYRKLEVNIFSKEARILDVLIYPVTIQNKITIKEIVIRDFDVESDIPSSMSLLINGLEMDLDSIVDNAPAIRDLGYEGIALFNLHVDYVYDRDLKNLHIERLALGAEDAGEININLHLSNINLSPMGMVGLIFTYPQVMFHKAGMEYRDASLMDRIFTLEAKKEGESLQELKQYLINEINRQIEEQDDEFIKKTLMEIEKFIRKPKSLSVTAIPSRPHPLGRIMRVDDSEDLIKLLNIQIKS